VSELGEGVAAWLQEWRSVTRGKKEQGTGWLAAPCLAASDASSRRAWDL